MLPTFEAFRDSNLYYAIEPSSEGTYVPDTMKHWTTSVLPRSVRSALAQSVAGNRATRREAEFKLGRQLASSLLIEASHDSTDTNVGAVGVNEDRSPNWPTGFIGSISHSDQWTWVAITSSQSLSSIGIDTEPVSTEETRLQIQRDIASPAEWARVDSLPLNDEERFTLVFSAKEAFYKCIFPLERTYFGFESAEVVHADQCQIRIRRRGSIMNDRNGEDGVPALNSSELDIQYCLTHGSVFTATWINHSEIE